MKRILAGAVGVLTAALVFGGSVAGAASPAINDAIAKRKANYKEIGGAFKTINDELRTGSPDTNTIRPLAKDLAARAAATLKYFPRGSGPESGAKTRAKSDIWNNQAEFVAIQKRMIDAANQLQRASLSGDAAAMAASRNALGATCKSCHDRFRIAD